MEKLLISLEELKKRVDGVLNDPLKVLLDPPLKQSVKSLEEYKKYCTKLLWEIFEESLTKEEGSPYPLRKTLQGFMPIKISWKEYTENDSFPPKTKAHRNSFIYWGKSLRQNMEAFILLVENSDYVLGLIEEPITEYTEKEAMDKILVALSKMNQDAHYLLEALMQGNGFLPRSSTHFEELAKYLEEIGCVQKFSGAGPAKVRLTIKGRRHVEEVLAKAQRLTTIKQNVRIQLGHNASQVVHNLRQLLAADALEDVCDHLDVTISNTDLKDELIMIYGTLNFARKNRDIGTITSSEYDVKRSQVRQALLNLIGKLKDSDLILG